MNCAAILSTPIDFDFGEGYGTDWGVVHPNVAEWTLKECYDYLSDRGEDLPIPNPFDMDKDEILDYLESEEWSEATRQIAINQVEADNIDEWRDAVEEAFYQDDSFTPMMNYAYPLPDFFGDLADASSKLVKAALSLTVVEIHEEPFLALTGCGMDFSQDICEAYILLGYHPPFHFTDFSGNVPKKLLDAAMETNRILGLWLENRNASLKSKVPVDL